MNALLILGALLAAAEPQVKFAPAPLEPMRWIVNGNDYTLIAKVQGNRAIIAAQWIAEAEEKTKEILSRTDGKMVRKIRFVYSSYRCPLWMDGHLTQEAAIREILRLKEEEALQQVIEEWSRISSVFPEKSAKEKIEDIENFLGFDPKEDIGDEDLQLSIRRHRLRVVWMWRLKKLLKNEGKDKDVRIEGLSFSVFP